MKRSSGVRKPSLGPADCGHQDLHTPWLTHRLEMKSAGLRSSCLARLKISKLQADVFKSLSLEDCFGLLPLCVLLGLMKTGASPALPFTVVGEEEGEQDSLAQHGSMPQPHSGAGCEVQKPACTCFLPSSPGWSWRGAYLLLFITVGLLPPQCASA